MNYILNLYFYTNLLKATSVEHSVRIVLPTNGLQDELSILSVFTHGV